MDKKWVDDSLQAMQWLPFHKYVLDVSEPDERRHAPVLPMWRLTVFSNNPERVAAVKRLLRFAGANTDTPYDAVLHCEKESLRQAFSDGTSTFPTSQLCGSWIAF